MSSRINPWRVAVCGCGSSIDLYEGLHHRFNSFQVVSAADLHVERAQKAARRWGGINAYSSATRMLDNEKPDLLIIATPPDNHLELALEAAARGVHLLIQKPLTCSVAEGKTIIDCCRSNQCGLKVSFARRYYHAFQKAYELINTSGQGLLFRCTWHSTSGRKDRPTKQWKKDRQTRGGVLVDLGSHVIDLARWWMGEAIGCRLAMSVVKGELDNIAVFILNHENGSITQGSLSNVAFADRESYEYIGTEGGLVLKRTGGGYPGSWSLTGYRYDGSTEQWSFGTDNDPPEENPFLLELDDFISELQKDRIPIDPLNLGYRTLEWTTLLYKSSAAGNDMDLEGFSINDFFKI